VGDEPKSVRDGRLIWPKALLILFIFSLGFMQPNLRLLGFAVLPSDLIYLLLAPVWAAAVLTKRARLVWDRAWWPLLFYFAAMAVSVVAADEPSRSIVKLLTQVYLLSLPVIACSLIETREDLRRMFASWLFASAAIAVVGVATFILFRLDRENALLKHMLFHFGTLPPGDYPRFRLTFINANMLCNYLSVSLMVLLAAAHSGWVSRRAAVLLGSGIAFCLLFTISPGLGGAALAVGLWTWVTLSGRRRIAGRTALVGGTAAALLFLPAMALTPILHSTAPYLVHIPLFDLTLAPAGRLMIWTQALGNFLADPLLGRGIGADAVLVRYADPSGHLQRLTDAHNSYLSIAVQSGFPGLFGLLMITFAAWRMAVPYRAAGGGGHARTVALAIAFLGGFAYQGLGGSFEDARHLWLLFGLLVASRQIEAREAELEAAVARP
jgi:O-antigen ligase